MEADRSEFTVCMNRKWRGGDHRMKKIFNAGLGLLVATCMALPAYAQDDEVEEQSVEARGADDSELEFDEIITTGTRLGRRDLSARVETITADEIEARGLATLEDVIRSIPQNYSSINSATNLATAQNPSDVRLGNVGVGISTANLRGLGSAATLVLVNGRRLAGSAGQEDFFTNLRDIPAAAIERVEVLLDGGSQIYGADAIGGVINIVLKKNYTGAQFSARYEDSSTGGDLERLSAYFGYAWGSGSVSATASQTKRDPVANADVGFTTRDHRPFFPTDDPDQNAVLDARLDTPRSGVLFFLSDPRPRQLFILPPGNDGRNIAGRGDLIPYDPETDRLDQIDPHAISERDDTSVTINLEQSLFDGRVVLRGELLQTRAESVRQFNVGPLEDPYLVPEENAFNNFGEAVAVQSYFPTREFADGLVPAQQQNSITKQRRHAFGIDLHLTDTLQLTAETLRSRSDGEATQIAFRTRVNAAFTPNPQLQTRLDSLLSSDDPNVAVNFFGDGSGQNASIAEFFIPAFGVSGVTRTNQFTTYLKGELFELPAGAVDFVIGREVRDERVPNTFFDSVLEDIARDSANRDVTAVFAELWVPIFSSENAIPGFHGLSLTLQARHDDYELSGAVGREPPPFPPGPPIIVEKKFDRTSPRYGLSWAPTEDLLVRGSYSEGFQPPAFTDLFNASDLELSLPFPFIFDPLLGRSVPGTLSTGGNIDLVPETSENISAGFTYTPSWVSGLQVSVDYSRLDFSNRIAGAFELLNLLEPEVVGNLPDLFIRDADGNLETFVSRPVNISKTVSDILDADISYRFETSWGVFEPGVYVSYVLDQFNQAAPGGEEVSFRGRTIGLDRYILTGRLGWEHDRWSGAMFVNHTPSYQNESVFVPEVAQLEIESRTTVDFSVAYHRDDLGLTVRGGARNLFDEDFPFGFFGGGAPFDGRRVDLRGRVLYLEATVDFSNLIGRN